MVRRATLDGFSPCAVMVATFCFSDAASRFVARMSAPTPTIDASPSAQTRPDEVLLPVMAWRPVYHGRHDRTEPPRARRSLRKTLPSGLSVSAVTSSRRALLLGTVCLAG